MSNTANGFFPMTFTASARCAVSSVPLASTYSYSIVRPHVWYESASTAFSSITASFDSPFAPVAWFLMPPFVDARSLSAGGTSTTTLIESAVTPCAVAPPLSSPSLHGRTHGGAP